MATVTFSSSVGGDNSVVTDDADPSTGLANGGHRLRFVPALAQVVAVAGNTVTQATNAAASAAAASADAAVAAASWDFLDDRFLGGKTSNPTLDNDGNALVAGSAYWNTSANEWRVWDGAAWVVVSLVPTAASSISNTAKGYITNLTVQGAIDQIGIHAGSTINLANSFRGL